MRDFSNLRLMEHIFVGSAARHADRVVIDVHQVL